jgi:hypothetical protein
MDELRVVINGQKINQIGCGGGFDSAEPFDPESFDPESFDPELTTEGLTTDGLTIDGHMAEGLTTEGLTTEGITTDGLVAGQPRLEKAGYKNYRGRMPLPHRKMSNGAFTSEDLDEFGFSRIHYISKISTSSDTFFKLNFPRGESEK